MYEIHGLLNQLMHHEKVPVLLIYSVYNHTTALSSLQLKGKRCRFSTSFGSLQCGWWVQMIGGLLPADEWGALGAVSAEGGWRLLICIYYPHCSDTKLVEKFTLRKSMCTVPPHTQLHGKPPDYHTLCTSTGLVVSSAYGFEQLWTSERFGRDPENWPSLSPSLPDLKIRATDEGTY